MPHPFFDAGSYPWQRPDARALKDQLRTLITNVPEIVAIYERSGGDRASLNTNSTPDDVWQSALNLLAGAGLLRNLIDELESITRLKGNTAFQAAVRAVRDARPVSRASLSQSPSGTAGGRFGAVVGIVIAVLALTIFVFVGSAIAQSAFSIDVPWIPGTGQSPGDAPGPDQEGGETEGTIPAVVGSSYLFAMRTLHDAGFDNVIVKQVDSAQPASTVISCTPQEGTTYGFDQPVTIEISNGFG
jgi:hypothetical protein